MQGLTPSDCAKWGLILMLMCFPALGQNDKEDSTPEVEQTQASTTADGSQDTTNGEKSAEVPAPFVPREKISSDSVISFPADI
jgi:hypothetical protein